VNVGRALFPIIALSNALTKIAPKFDYQDKFGRDGPGPLGYKVSMTYKGITLLSGKGGRGVSFTKGAKDVRPTSTGQSPIMSLHQN